VNPVRVARVFLRHLRAAAAHLAHEQRAVHDRHGELAEHAGSPHARPEVPLVIRKEVAVEDRECSQLRRVQRRERQAIRAADVVNDEVHAIEVERGEQIADERGLVLERAVEVARRARVAEAR
jgi:hypothetical protein